MYKVYHSSFGRWNEWWVAFITWLVVRMWVPSSRFITFHHLVGGTRMSSFFPWLVAWMASCQMILEYGLYISSPGWWHGGEYGLYISSPGRWHEDEFILHLVGGISGKLPNDIRVRVVHFITLLVLWRRVRVIHFITWFVAWRWVPSSLGWWHEWQVSKWY